jgi:hypothetical protein
MTIEHTVTAKASGASLSLAELDAFLRLASDAGAGPDDLATSPVSLSSGLKQVSVTITAPEPPAPVQTPVQAHDDPATVEFTPDLSIRPSPRPRTTRKPADATP